MSKTRKTTKISAGELAAYREIQLAADKAGVSWSELAEDMFAWAELFAPLAERHDVALTAVIEIHTALRDECEEDADRPDRTTEDAMAGLIRRINGIADKHGIPADLIRELAGDLHRMIEDGRDRLTRTLQ